MTARPFKTFARPFLIASLLALAGAAGVFLFLHLRGETKPDPGKPPEETLPPEEQVVVRILAAFPGASPEEVERQVTIPLEAALAGLPRLQTTRSRSFPGLARLDIQFTPGTDPEKARQEVINRLQFVPTLPEGANPQLLPNSSGVVLRYTLKVPKDLHGRDVYTAADLRALQDWVLEREWRRVAGVGDVLSSGGAVKRYEIHPDPDRLKRFGITLEQLRTAIVRANANAGLLGAGKDPLDEALALKSPAAAAAHLRAEEQRRLREIRQLVVDTVNNRPVTVEDLVDGGPVARGEEPRRQGVVVGHAPRQGRVGLGVRKKGGGPGKGWAEEEDRVQGVVLLRRGESPERILAAVLARVEELNDTPGRLLPGVGIEPFYQHAEGEEGNVFLWIHGNLPANASLAEASRVARAGRALLRGFPEIVAVVSQVGGEDDDGVPAGTSQVQMGVRLLPLKDWPVPARRERPRTPTELMRLLEAELKRKQVGVDWRVTAGPANLLPSPFAPASDEHLVKIFGPALDRLEQLAARVRAALQQVRGVEAVGILHLMGRRDLAMRVDLGKCKRWGVRVGEIQDTIAAGVGGLGCGRMIEGDKSFAMILRWPGRLREGPEALLNIPVVCPNPPAQGAGPVLSAPALRLQDVVSPTDREGRPDPQGAFFRTGPAVIYREDGKRLIAVRFRVRVRDRDPADATAEAARRTAKLFQEPYRVDWGKE